MRMNVVNKFYKTKVNYIKYIIVSRIIRYYVENYRQENLNKIIIDLIFFPNVGNSVYLGI